MKIAAISISDEKGVKKDNVESAQLKADHGIEGDAHAGQWHRQISLLASESIEKMTALGLNVGPGDFAENITTVGVDLSRLPVGTRIRLGDNTLVEITQIGKECHDRCAIYFQAGDCVMPKEGIFVKVLKGGPIRTEDSIIIEDEGKAVC
ncbi:MAG: MOSC domain-containing protein [bacterium]